MILCHKCSGVLTADDDEARGLRGCGCISGWVRGFEPVLTRAEAIAAQLAQCERNIALYTRQGRADAWLKLERDAATRLQAFV